MAHLEGLVSILVIGRNPKLKKGGYSARSYLEVLKEDIPRC